MSEETRPPSRRALLATLLGLKLRLMFRTLARNGIGRAFFLALTLGIVFAPLWLGLATATYFGTLRFGAPMVMSALGLIHIAWIGGSLLFGSFAEGIDLGRLARYPIEPRTAFWLNVIVAPADFVAFFLLPPIATTVVATAQMAGGPTALAVLAAALVQLFLTGTVVLALLALLGRYLRREWTRALLGLAIGISFAAPGMMLRTRAASHVTAGANHWDQLAEVLPLLSRAFSWFPTTAFPVRAVAAAFAGSVVGAAAFLCAGIVLLVALVRVGAVVAMSEAQNREVTQTSSRDERQRRGLDDLFARVLPQDLATLLARDLRTFRRTPQILLGLLTAPFFLVVMSRSYAAGASSGIFLVALCGLLTALSLTSNQYGLDGAGVRFLFLLPISARRLIVSKNIACAFMAFATFFPCLAVAEVVGPRLDAIGAVTALVTEAAAMPVVIAFGNYLSVRSPWRMQFRLGGAPPGAMSSAFSQLTAIGVVIALLSPGILILPAVFGPSVKVRLLSLWVTYVIAGGLWWIWWRLLPRAAHALDARRELIIDRLAHMTETG